MECYHSYEPYAKNTNRVSEVGGALSSHHKSHAYLERSGLSLFIPNGAWICASVMAEDSAESER